jgi:hypothetical protein
MENLSYSDTRLNRFKDNMKTPYILKSKHSLMKIEVMVLLYKKNKRWYERIVFRMLLNQYYTKL